MGKNLANIDYTFFLCDGGSCKKAGSENVLRYVRAYMRNNKLWEKTHTIKTRCNGRCEDAPTCIVQPGNYWYKKLTPEIGVKLVKSHIEENKPLTHNVLYNNKLDGVNSDNERAKISVKPFELKVDEDLGTCAITRGFSSDQYLYPLFLFLWQNPSNTWLKIAGKEPIYFDMITNVVYDKVYQLQLITEREDFEFTIAVIPQNDVNLRKSKITITEYYFIVEKEEAGVRFKNKLGETIGNIIIPNYKDNKAWKYCLEVQLQMKKELQLI